MEKILEVTGSYIRCKTVDIENGARQRHHYYRLAKSGWIIPFPMI